LPGTSAFNGAQIDLLRPRHGWEEQHREERKQKEAAVRNNAWARCVICRNQMVVHGEFAKCSHASRVSAIIRRHFRLLMQF
jgi:hypothetical protein